MVKFTIQSKLFIFLNDCTFWINTCTTFLLTTIKSCLNKEGISTHTPIPINCIIGNSEMLRHVACCKD